MKAEVVFLGTSTGVPTKDRSHAAVFFRYNQHRFLFDCGEGTQRQLLKAGKSAMKISHVFVSHVHGDHVLGLPGLLQSTDFMERKEPLVIVGPEGTEELIDTIKKIPGCDARFPVKVKDARGIVLDDPEFTVKAFALDHSLPCAGYVFEEKPRTHVDEKKLREKGVKPGPVYGKLQKGKKVTHKGEKLDPKDFVSSQKGLKVVYVADTRPTESIIENSLNADLLIHESTFAHDAKDMAVQTKHSTAREAGQSAREAGVKQLALMHYSPRYKDDDLDKLRQDAQKEFDNVLLARDLETIKL
jgi:ribonuclease Z